MSDDRQARSNDLALLASEAALLAEKAALESQNQALKERAEKAEARYRRLEKAARETLNNINSGVLLGSGAMKLRQILSPTQETDPG